LTRSREEGGSGAVDHGHFVNRRLAIRPALHFSPMAANHDDDESRDPVVEALVQDVDMTLIRRNLKMTPQQRLDQLIEMQRFAVELREAGRKVRRKG
jgi:hypothetical protein